MRGKEWPIVNYRNTRSTARVCHMTSTFYYRTLPSALMLMQTVDVIMSANRLQLNCIKTEFMWLTTARSQHRLPTSGPLIGSTMIAPSSTVHDISIFIDQDLPMRTHAQRTASCSFATLRQLRTIPRCLPTSVFQSVAAALVLSRLDYCNSLLFDLPAILI